MIKQRIHAISKTNYKLKRSSVSPSISSKETYDINYSSDTKPDKVSKFKSSKPESMKLKSSKSESSDKSSKLKSSRPEYGISEKISKLKSSKPESNDKFSKLKSSKPESSNDKFKLKASKTELKHDPVTSSQLLNASNDKTSADKSKLKLSKPEGSPQKKKGYFDHRSTHNINTSLPEIPHIPSTPIPKLPNDRMKKRSQTISDKKRKEKEIASSHPASNNQTSRGSKKAEEQELLSSPPRNRKSMNSFPATPMNSAASFPMIPFPDLSDCVISGNLVRFFNVPTNSRLATNGKLKQERRWCTLDFSKKTFTYAKQVGYKPIGEMDLKFATDIEFLVLPEEEVMDESASASVSTSLRDSKTNLTLEPTYSSTHLTAPSPSSLVFGFSIICASDDQHIQYSFVSRDKSLVDKISYCIYRLIHSEKPVGALMVDVSSYNGLDLHDSDVGITCNVKVLSQSKQTNDKIHRLIVVGNALRQSRSSLTGDSKNKATPDYCRLFILKDDTGIKIDVHPKLSNLSRMNLTPSASVMNQRQLGQLNILMKDLADKTTYSSSWMTIKYASSSLLPSLSSNGYLSKNLSASASASTPSTTASSVNPPSVLIGFLYDKLVNPFPKIDSNIDSVIRGSSFNPPTPFSTLFPSPTSSASVVHQSPMSPPMKTNSKKKRMSTPVNISNSQYYDRDIIINRSPTSKSSSSFLDVISQDDDDIIEIDTQRSSRHSSSAIEDIAVISGLSHLKFKDGKEIETLKDCYVVNNVTHMIRKDEPSTRSVRFTVLQHGVSLSDAEGNVIQEWSLSQIKEWVCCCCCCCCCCIYNLLRCLYYIDVTLLCVKDSGGLVFGYILVVMVVMLVVMVVVIMVVVTYLKLLSIMV
eukprot:TRINITY_DN2100_c0_g1_i1.p1 TRINITY_DN2100_c0_g1~~TRINITY_DN2100_c0_g1_i1.p1  ORF type:complete len:1020 (-),score=179.96 TRINITY_DN2100_c0_g1_i1:619-3222(-)